MARQTSMIIGLVGLLAATQVSLVRGDYCITQWWPRTCEDSSLGNCVGGSQNFISEIECYGGFIPSTDGWCVTRWWPIECEEVANGNCIVSDYFGNSYDETEADCLGAFGAEVVEDDSDKWCVEAWWPLACGQVSDDNCVGGSPTYDTEEDCRGPGATPPPDPSLWCIISWFPRVCEQAGEDNCVLGTPYYDSEEQCGPDFVPDASQWCIASWLDNSCAMVSSGNCVGGTQYFDSEEDCAGFSGSNNNDPASSESWCLVDLFPLECGIVNTDPCQSLATTYATEDACLAAQDTPDPQAWCTTQWWPLQCQQLTILGDDDSCLSTVFHPTQEQCEGTK